MDQQKIAKAVKDLLIAIGEDPEREGLAETPQLPRFPTFDCPNPKKRSSKLDERPMTFPKVNFLTYDI